MVPPHWGAAEQPAGDDLMQDFATGFSVGTADCSIARPAYHIVFRTSGDGARPSELYLCGHHYRRSTAALLELQAAVYDEAHRLLASFS